MCSFAQICVGPRGYVAHIVTLKGGHTMTSNSDWRHLAEQASVEMDSNKLSALVEELNRVLDEQDALRTKRRGVVCSSFPPATAEPFVA